MSVLRIALCQLECHPALYLNHIGYLEEPFVPRPGEPSLSSLAAKGVNVESLQSLCKAEYEKWAQIRLECVLQNLAALNQPPDLIMFPEGAIPVSCLPLVKEMSDQHFPLVLAGSHTPLTTASAGQAYKKLNIQPGRVKKMSHRGVQNVLPAIYNSKTRLVEKSLHSPFERQEISRGEKGSQKLRSLTAKIGEDSVIVLPMICSEALQQPHVSTNHDLIAILSFDANPQQFESFADQQVKNQKPVAFCNDGFAGGTRLFAVDDRRTPEWLRDAMPTGLPPGDAVLLVDVDLEVKAVEVDTATPRAPVTLVAVRPIVPDSGDSQQTSATLDEILQLTSSEARAQELSALLKLSTLTPLQQVCVDHLRDLERKGVPSGDWWSAIGLHYVAQGIPPLDQLEARLAKSCHEHLIESGVQSASRSPETAQSLVGFLAQCQRRAKSATESLAPVTIDQASPTIDRDSEVQEICTFVDTGSEAVLELTGLRQIGKNKVADKAIAQLGDLEFHSVELTSTSSADYLVYSVLQLTGSAAKPPYADPVEIARSDMMRRALRRVKLLRIEKCHLLLDHGVWRDESLHLTLIAVIELAIECGTKLILESQREIPLELEYSRHRKRLRITGLHRQFGRSLLESQLRRVGLSSAAVDHNNKDVIVSKLGGHPVAIAIAADAVYENGQKDTVESIKKKKGFYENFLGGLVRSLHLTDTEHTILQLFCLARNDLPREVITETLELPNTEALQNLRALGAVEVGRHGMYRIASVLREYFDSTTLSPDTANRFHRAASLTLGEISKEKNDNLALAVESEYHATLAGIPPPIDSEVIDGALGSAQRLYDDQKYDEAGVVLHNLLQGRRQQDVLRLSALTAARRNKLDDALAYAKEVFKHNPHDTWLLAELAKIALTQSQDDIAEQLVSIARSAQVEDVSILLVEGRMYLRRKDHQRAEVVFSRARNLTQYNPWPFYYLGRTYFQLGRPDDAIDVLFEGEQFCYDMRSRNRRALHAIKTQLATIYLLQDETELAAPIIDGLFEEDPNSPEVIRAYAALTIKREGISEAHQALKRLEKARIRNQHDRCQFHLLYGLFYLGIGDNNAAYREFSKAHSADRQNVFVMIKQARTLFDIAKDTWADGNDAYEQFAKDCAKLVQQILRFDVDNRDGIDLLHELRTNFGIEL